MQYCIAAWLSSYMYVIDQYVVKKVELGGPGDQILLEIGLVLSLRCLGDGGDVFCISYLCVDNIIIVGTLYM